VLGMPAQGKPGFTLLQHGVDAAQTVHRRIRHGLEALEGCLQMGENGGTGPASLDLLSRQERVIDGFLVLRAAPKWCARSSSTPPVRPA